MVRFVSVVSFWGNAASVDSGKQSCKLETKGFSWVTSLAWIVTVPDSSVEDVCRGRLCCFSCEPGGYPEQCMVLEIGGVGDAGYQVRKQIAGPSLQY